MSPLSWTPISPPSLPYPSRLSQTTSFGCPASCIELTLVIYFIDGNVHESENEVAQSCPTLHDPMDCSLPGFSIHGIFQARVLEWGAITFSVRIETVPFFLFPWFSNNNNILVGKADQFWQPWWERWILHLPRLGAGGPSLDGMLNGYTWVRQEALDSHTPVTTEQAGLGDLPLSFWSPRALAAWSVGCD